MNSLTSNLIFKKLSTELGGIFLSDMHINNLNIIKKYMH